MEVPNGDFALLEKVLEGANTEVDEAAEERKGGAGCVGWIAWLTAIFRYSLVEYPDVPRKGAMHILRHACMGGAWQLAARVLHVERVAQPSLTAYCTSPDSGALVRCLPQLATTS